MAVSRRLWQSFLFGRRKFAPLLNCAQLSTESSKIVSTLKAEKLESITEFTRDVIRNFSIIAHVDHGKSTLADRLLEITGSIPKYADFVQIGKPILRDAQNAQVLDKLEVERERGITVKAQTASMFYELDGVTYLLNLIDTPGHVDFNFEVMRSLSASDGALLLVDANQGIQAQTVANFYLAFERELKIIPVLNKIDLKDAKPEQVAEEMFTMFEINPNDCVKVSAKFGTGVSELLKAIIHSVPPPNADINAPLRAYIFDSWFEFFKGAFVFVLIKDGFVERGQEIVSLHSKLTYQVQEVGVMRPDPTPVTRLCAGQVGYILANMKSTKDAIVGDTLAWTKSPDVLPLPGLRISKPMVFAGLFPVEAGNYAPLKTAIEKLCLNDPAVRLEPESTQFMGLGWRTGFLGLLHMEVFYQRLEQEYDESVLITPPSVGYKARIKDNDAIRKRYGGQAEIEICDPAKFPLQSDVEEFQEPIVEATIVSPTESLARITELCKSLRGVYKSVDHTPQGDRVIIKFILPLAEILVDFFGELKRLSSGHASLDYEEVGWIKSDLVKMDILLNRKKVEEFSVIVPREAAVHRGKRMCLRLKEEIPRHQFEVTIQAAVGQKIVARQDISPVGKNIALKGGKGGKFGHDVTRKMKLLDRQAEGKKRMKEIGQVQIPKDVFLNIAKSYR